LDNLTDLRRLTDIIRGGRPAHTAGVRPAPGQPGGVPIQVQVEAEVEDKVEEFALDLDRLSSLEARIASHEDETGRPQRPAFGTGQPQRDVFDLPEPSPA